MACFRTGPIGSTAPKVSQTSAQAARTELTAGQGVTQCGIPVGQSLLYNFTVDGQFGTYWYHSHVATQYLDGIIGPLVVHAPEEAEARKLYDQEQILLLQDWYHDFSTVNIGRYLIPNNENSEPIPDNGLINGFN